MPARATSPSAQWRETPGSGAAVQITRQYWTIDPITSIWSLTTNPQLESGRLADIDGSGTFALVPFATMPAGAPTESVAQRGGMNLIY